MTEQQKMEIEVGMRVMVKVAAREIPATVIEVRDDCFIVRSDSTGREFRTTRVVDILDQPETDDTEIAEAAAAVAAEEDATAELRRREEEGADAAEAEKPVDGDATKADGEAPKAEELPTADEQPKADEYAPKAEEPPTADDADGAAPAADGGEAQGDAADARPRKNLSLVDAAIEVLKAEKRPMGAKELVKLAVERGLWIPTKAKTPDQSLYGGLYLEMKNSSPPRVRKSADKGKFELV